mgnify:CR=1 FL=1
MGPEPAPLERALDLGWEILAGCFAASETGMPSELIEQFWPGDKDETQDSRKEENESEQEDEATAETAQADLAERTDAAERTADAYRRTLSAVADGDLTRRRTAPTDRNLPLAD